MSEQDETPTYQLARLTLELRLDDEGDEQVILGVEPEGISLVTLLGMLEFAKDTIIRDRMGDATDDDG